jgi:hypothetical protein
MQETSQPSSRWTHLPATRRYGGRRDANVRSASRVLARPPSVQVCVCCGAITTGASRGHEVLFCSECLDRSREHIGRDYDAAELGGEA